MNTLAVCILTLALLLACTCGIAGATQKDKPSDFVCRMDLLGADERKELSGAIDHLLAAARSCRELSNGYEIRFANPAVFPDAAKWASLEHRCCAFFDISLSLSRNGGPLVVRLTGAKGAKEFLDADLPKLVKLAKH